MVNYRIQSEKKIEKIIPNYTKELLIIVLLVMSYVVNVPFLILASFVLACGFVVFSEYRKAIYYLAFFTSFAGIFVYNGRHMFFVMAALFVMKSLISSKINRATFFFYLAILAYSILFSDFQGEFSFAKIIGLILMFVIPLIAYSSDEIDCKVFMQHYILGFVISTIIGLFAKNIPSMYQLFDVDLMWTENNLELTRFFGLAFDSNFYALSNYIIIAYLLFAFEKITPFRGLLTLFLLIAGVMTISKSYFLVIGVLLIFYIAKNICSMKQLIIFALVAIAGIWIFSAVSTKLGYNAITIITSRFVKGGSLADNTTGRTDIWKYYIDLFNANGIKEVLFGFGFNAKVDRAAHNTFIEFAYHYGIIGLILWGAYLFYCLKLFQIKAKSFENKSSMVCICLIVGIFFLSAYSYESFWIGIVISFMTLGKRKQIGEEYVQRNSTNL